MPKHLRISSNDRRSRDVEGDVARAKNIPSEVLGTTEHKSHEARLTKSKRDSPRVTRQPSGGAPDAVQPKPKEKSQSARHTSSSSAKSGGDVARDFKIDKPQKDKRPRRAKSDGDITKHQKSSPNDATKNADISQQVAVRASVASSGSATDLNTILRTVGVDKSGILSSAGNKLLDTMGVPRVLRDIALKALAEEVGEPSNIPLSVDEANGNAGDAVNTILRNFGVDKSRIINSAADMVFDTVGVPTALRDMAKKGLANKLGEPSSISLSAGKANRKAGDAVVGKSAVQDALHGALGNFGINKDAADKIGSFIPHYNNVVRLERLARSVGTGELDRKDLAAQAAELTAGTILSPLGPLAAPVASKVGNMVGSYVG